MSGGIHCWIHTINSSFHQHISCVGNLEVAQGGLWPNQELMKWGNPSGNG